MQRAARWIPSSLMAVISAALTANLPAGQAPRGFEPLFDGRNLDAFKASDDARAHWRIENGVLKYDGKEKDLWSKRSYRNFIVKLDWRFPGPGPRRAVDDILPSGDVAKDEKGQPRKIEIQYGGDSGVYLRGSSKSQVNIWNWPIGSGEVYGYRTDASQPADVRAGVTPKARADRQLGEWNSMTILLEGDRLSVDLNGVNVVSRAKLPEVPAQGPIALQNHGDPVEFREIYIRELPDDIIDLLDGATLAGWKAVEAAKDTWTVRDGKLICSGKPHGYLRTEKAYENYVLEGEWLFPGKGGSTGLLLHVTGDDKVWPPSIEIQTDHTYAGNFIKIGGVSFEGGKRTENAEKPVGEWNHFEATVKGDVIECFVNGKKVSEARKCSPTKGAIGFQSEGVEVHIRNVWLRPLPR